MHNKKLDNNNKSQNFIQGLRPLSNSMPHGLKKILKKGGYNFSNIVNNWSKMVGKNISNICYPKNIKMNNDRIEPYITESKTFLILFILKRYIKPKNAIANTP